MQLPDIPQHSESIIALLEAVEADKQLMLKLGMAVVADGGNFFPLDMMAFGALKRNISTSSAMITMVKTWNMVCARTLLRTHIDTSLRFSASWLVDEPHTFATNVLKGQRIDRMKDRTGNRMTDAHLVERSTNDYPWLPKVYESLSGYIHFSGSHISDSIVSLDDSESKFSFEITDTDLKFSDFSWIEILECFREVTDMLAKYLHAYRMTKDMTPEQLEAEKCEG